MLQETQKDQAQSCYPDTEQERYILPTSIVLLQHSKYRSPNPRLYRCRI